MEAQGIHCQIGPAFGQPAYAAGVNKVGAEGEIFRRVIRYSLILTAALGVLAMIEAYVIPGIVPTP